MGVEYYTGRFFLLGLFTQDETGLDNDGVEWIWDDFLPGTSCSHDWNINSFMKTIGNSNNFFRIRAHVTCDLAASRAHAPDAEY